MEISDNTRKHLLRNCAIATVVSLCALATLYWLTSAYVIRQAEKNIENLLLAHKGIHHYVQQVMHPALYGYQQDGEIPADFYAPELFSSSFIVRNQHLYFNREREPVGAAAHLLQDGGHQSTQSGEQGRRTGIPPDPAIQPRPDPPEIPGNHQKRRQGISVCRPALS